VVAVRSGYPVSVDNLDLSRLLARTWHASQASRLRHSRQLIRARAYLQSR
jgi:hypothetical protein